MISPARPIRRPCLDCRRLSACGSRCEECQAKRDAFFESRRVRPPRPHYAGDYKKRAKHVRDTATVCWICGDGARPTDPWTADHLIPGDPDSLLAAAHRSCNSRRRNTPFEDTVTRR